MRIIGGMLKGKKLGAFDCRKIRPTSDRVKESLFNILGRDFCQGITVLDLFSGTGNLGIEALSRGAKKCVFVEKDRDAVKILKSNIESCRMEGSSSIINIDALKSLALIRERGETFGLVFLDPPYFEGLYDSVMGMIGEGGGFGDAVVVAEHDAKEILKESYGFLSRYDSRRYGGTMISFYSKEQE